MTDLPKPPKRPCGSCPYRKDVPSGVWAGEEYAKLRKFDGEPVEQFMNGGTALFMCHQRDGCLCGGWLQAHGTDNLMALRMHPVDESAWGYTSDVECFSSGAEAAAHGMRDIEHVGEAARALQSKIVKLPGIKMLDED